MRTTKYEWVCLARNINFQVGYDPTTGGTWQFVPGQTIPKRQEMWIKANIRPDKVGNEYFVVQAEKGSSIYYDSENNYGVIIFKDIPEWAEYAGPPIYIQNGAGVVKEAGRGYGGYSFVHWPVVRGTIANADKPDSRDWLRFQSVENDRTGTRFNKHIEAKVSSNREGTNGTWINDYSPPIQPRPDDVGRFERAERRLAINIELLNDLIKED